MKINLKKLEDEIEDACIKACEIFSIKLHNEIQRVINNINVIYPIDYIRMGNGGYSIGGGIVEYYDLDDDEYCKFKLQDLSYDGVHKSEYWNYLDESIYDEVEYLFELLGFLIDDRYTTLKDFKAGVNYTG